MCERGEIGCTCVWVWGTKTREDGRAHPQRAHWRQVDSLPARGVKKRHPRACCVVAPARRRHGSPPTRRGDCTPCYSHRATAPTQGATPVFADLLLWTQRGVCTVRRETYAMRMRSHVMHCRCRWKTTSRPPTPAPQRPRLLLRLPPQYGSSCGCSRSPRCRSRTRGAASPCLRRPAGVGAERTRRATRWR